MQPTVFVSSTFTDLHRHRQLVQEAIGALQFQSKAMEFFGALPETPKEECLSLVRSSSVYVGIFGMRYGFIDPATGKSLTQLEYEEAQVVRLPSLIYLIDEETHAVLPKHVDIGPASEALRDFKTSLKKAHVVNFFSSPEDLAFKISRDLVQLMDFKASTPTARVLSQIALNAVQRHPLTQPRFEYLKGRVSGVFKQDVPDSILREALELTISGDNMAAAFVLSRGSQMHLDDAVDGLMSIEKILIEIVEKGRATKSPSEEA